MLFHGKTITGIADPYYMFKVSPHLLQEMVVFMTSTQFWLLWVSTWMLCICLFMLPTQALMLPYVAYVLHKYSLICTYTHVVLTLALLEILFTFIEWTCAVPWQLLLRSVAIHKLITPLRPPKFGRDFEDKHACSSTFGQILILMWLIIASFAKQHLPTCWFFIEFMYILFEKFTVAYVLYQVAHVSLFKICNSLLSFNNFAIYEWATNSHSRKNGKQKPYCCLSLRWVIYVFIFAIFLTLHSNQGTNKTLNVWEQPLGYNLRPRYHSTLIIAIPNSENLCKMSTSAIKFVSFNTQGLQGNSKRKKVFHWLKKKKANIYMLQETHSTSNIETKWHAQWGSKTIFSHGTSEKLGVSIFFNGNFDYEIIDSMVDEHGRFILLDMNINSVHTLVVNIYAPNGDFEGFFQNITDRIKSFDCSNIIWGGDFNFVFNIPMDKKGGANVTHFKCRETVEEWMAENDSIDVWRKQHIHDNVYTWFSHKRPKKGSKQTPIYAANSGNNPATTSEYEYIACRLDFFLIPSHLEQNVVQNSILTGYHSDHSLVKLAIDINPVVQGKGFWKLNCSLLENTEYTDQIITTIRKTLEENPGTDDCLMWEQIKCNIRRDSISFSHRARKKRKSNLENLEKQKRTLQEELLTKHTNETVNALKEIENQIDQHIEFKAEGAAIRTRSTYYEQGEKSTKFFHNLEKSQAKSKIITCLMDNKGCKVSGMKDILETERNFFQGIYSSKIKRAECDQTRWDLFFAADTKNLDPLVDLEVPISEEELFKALLESDNNKSPGTDGLPVDFYKVFWPHVKKFMLASFTQSYKNGYLSITQRQGIISLIPKKDKDPLQLHNWRPLSILNHDQKLLTKVLANRIKPVLKHLISPEQTGFVGGRFIGENVLNLLSISDHLLKQNITGKAILLDYEKAFDSLEWHTIEAALLHHGFGPNFIKWVKCLQNRPESCVINAGHFSKFFEIHRGVRQGCPLSPYLFILTIEILAKQIREDPNIFGLKIGNLETKINLYADDMTLLLENNQENISRAIDTIDNFGKISGLNLNHAKTEYLNLGVPNDLDAGKPVTLLGVKICNNVEKMVDQNITPIMAKITNILRMWNMRNLSLFGRIYLVKSLCSSLFHHPCSVLPTLGAELIKNINTLFHNFVWSNGSGKIRRAVLMGPWDLGGAQMTNITCLLKTLHLKWIIRLESDITTAWKAYLTENFTIPDIRYSLKCNLAPKDSQFLFKVAPCPVWRDIIQSWCEINQNDTVDNWTTVTNQPIWLNSHIKPGGKPCFYSEWFNQGVRYISHLLVIEENRFCSLREFRERFDLRCNFLEMLSVLNSIPVEWRRIIRAGPCEEALRENYEGSGYLIESFINQSHRQIYNDLVKHVCDIPVDRFELWDREFNLKEFILDECEWFETFKLCFSWTTSTELRSFEYRFRMRCLMPNSRLVIMGIINEAACARCNNPLEDTKHMFWECPLVNTLWVEVIDWANRTLGIDIAHDPRICLFQLRDDTGTDIPDVLWLLTVITKKYIWSCKCSGAHLTLFNCLRKFRDTERLEALSAIRNRKVAKHQEKWCHLSSVANVGGPNNSTIVEEVDTSYLYVL